MYEVELKVPADHEAVRERLADLGTESRGTVTQVDTYYDAPHREFAETDEALRVRRERSVGVDDESDDEGGSSADRPTDDDGAELTYKGPKVDADSKTRREIETRVESGDAAEDIVRALGFEPAAEVRKTRDRYRVGDYAVVLDSVEAVGEFVEVETAADDVDAAREGAIDVLADLGLDPDDQVRTSYLGLLLDDA